MLAGWEVRCRVGVGDWPGQWHFNSSWQHWFARSEVIGRELEASGPGGWLHSWWLCPEEKL